MQAGNIARVAWFELVKGTQNTSAAAAMADCPRIPLDHRHLPWATGTNPNCPVRFQRENRHAGNWGSGSDRLRTWTGSSFTRQVGTVVAFKRLHAGFEGPEDVLLPAESTVGLG